jgi:hypothetical protein
MLIRNELKATAVNLAFQIIFDIKQIRMSDKNIVDYWLTVAYWRMFIFVFNRYFI